MAKKTNSKIFAKNEVLSSGALNQKFEDMGPINGIQPYNSSHVMDNTMTQPIGSKATPFGNLFCKGINLFTQSEVLALFSAGKLTAADRMLFIDPNTSGLYIFNGSQINQIGGDNMDYLFGNGSDGDVTLVANANYDVPKQFTNFTLNSGVTLSVTNPLTPLIIRCTGTCTINGTINLNGKGYSGVDENNKGINRSEYGAGGGTGGHSGYAGGASQRYPTDTSADSNFFFQRLLSFDFRSSFGSSGGKSADNVGGGNGGGAIIIIAKSIKGTGTITANGNAGSDGNNTTMSRTGGGGGGGGGEIGIITADNSFTGSITANGGAGGGGYYPGNAGGNGAKAVLII